MDILTLDRLNAGYRKVKESDLCVRTPLLNKVQEMFEIYKDVELYLKLENMQTTGSFKMRGIVTQFADIKAEWGTKEKPLISMSAGNYGKAFATMCKLRNLNALLLMPYTAPVNRANLIESLGVKVIQKKSSELEAAVEKYQNDCGCIYMHSFDDTKLMEGYSSIGFEILEDLPNPDIVLICCGGGALTAGVAAAIKLSGKPHCRIYGIEPRGASTMHDSFREGRPMKKDIETVAAGLAPPHAGSNAYANCKEFVTDILLVSDEEIISAMFALQQRGLMVETSGAAAFAALLHDKVPDVKGKRVVVVVTGGNITPEEISKLQSQK